MVMPGRKPLVQAAPPLVDVAKPMSDAPPLKMRPTWNALTMVEPAAKELASTSVACWLLELVKVSVLSWVSETFGGGIVVCTGSELDPPPQAAMNIRIPQTAAACRRFMGTFAGCAARAEEKRAFTVASIISKRLT